MTRAAAPALALAAPAASAQEPWSFRPTPNVQAPALDTEAAVGGGGASASTAVLEAPEGAALVTGAAGRLCAARRRQYLNFGELATGTGVADRGRHRPRGRRPARRGARRRAGLVAGGGVDVDAAPAASVRRTWVDPIFGARARQALGPRLSVEALGTVCGLGVGSDLQWGAVGRAAFPIDDRFTAGAGWRHLFLDCDDVRLVLEMTMSGPFVALDIAF